MSDLCVRGSHLACDDLLRTDFGELLPSDDVREWLNLLAGGLTDMLRDSLVARRGRDGIGDVARDKIRLTTFTYSIVEPGYIRSAGATANLSFGWDVEDLVWQPVLSDCDSEFRGTAQLNLSVRSELADPELTFRLTSLEGGTKGACPIIKFARFVTLIGSWLNLTEKFDLSFDAPNIFITKSLPARARERLRNIETLLGESTGVQGARGAISHLYFNERRGLSALYSVQFPRNFPSEFPRNPPERWRLRP